MYKTAFQHRTRIFRMLREKPQTRNNLLHALSEPYRSECEKVLDQLIEDGVIVVGPPPRRGLKRIPRYVLAPVVGDDQ